MPGRHGRACPPHRGGGRRCSAGRRLVEAQRAHGAQDVDLAVPQGLFVEARRQLHRDQGQDLEHVVLHHVPQGAGAVEVARPALQAQVLLPQDVDLLDVPTVPYRLQDPVGQAQRDQVMDGGQPEDVVYPEHRLFPGCARHLGEEPVECHGAVEVLAEGLLQCDPASVGEPGTSERGHHRRVQSGGQGQVGRPWRPDAGQQAAEARGVRHLCGAVAKQADKVRAGRGRHIRGVALQPVGGGALEGIVVEVFPGGCDDVEVGWKPARGTECGKGGQQESAGEVTGRAEQHQRLDQLLTPSTTASAPATPGGIEMPVIAKSL